MRKRSNLKLLMLTTLVVLSGILVACGDGSSVVPDQTKAGATPAIATPIAPTTASPGTTSVPTNPPPTTVASIPTPRLSEQPGRPATVKPAGDIPKLVKVQVNSAFNLRFGQVARIEAENIEISLGQILEDSRCPQNVSCVWSGQLIVSLSVSKNGKPLNGFNLNNLDAKRNKDKPSFENYNVALLTVMPIPYYDNYGASNAEIKPIKAEDYVLELVVTKLENGIVAPDKAVLERRVQLKFGETANYQAEGLSIRFTTLTKEARCPKSSNVVCSTSGQANIELTATKTSRNQPQTLSLAIPGLVDDTSSLNTKSSTASYITTFEGYKIQLLSLEPQPMSSNQAKPTAPELYIATFILTKEA